MPLINCPECKTEVSDKASACPKCAYPLAGKSAAPTGEPSTFFQHVGLVLCVLGGAVIGFTQQLAFMIFGPFMAGSSTASMPSEDKVRNTGILILVVGGVFLAKTLMDKIGAPKK